MKTPDIPIGTDRPPIEDSMSAVQALEDERATRVWLERERKTIVRRLTSEASVRIEALTLADAALRQLLIVFADPDLAASTSFNAERVETLRKDLEAIRNVVMTTGTVVRDGTGAPV